MLFLRVQLDEDAELARALALSMEENKTDAGGAGALQDMDTNDPLVQAALEQLRQAEEKKDEGDGGKKRKHDS